MVVGVESRSDDTGEEKNADVPVRSKLFTTVFSTLQVHRPYLRGWMLTLVMDVSSDGLFI